MENGHYLSKDKIDLARKLAQRDYDESLKKVLEERIATLKNTLLVYERGEPTDIYDSLSDERKKIIADKLYMMGIYVENGDE